MAFGRGNDERSWWSRHPLLATIVASVVMIAVPVIGIMLVVFRIPWQSDEASMRAMVFGGLALIPLAVAVVRGLGIRPYGISPYGEYEITVGGTVLAVSAGGVFLAILFASENLPVPFGARALVACAGMIAVATFGVWVSGAD